MSRKKIIRTSTVSTSLNTFCRGTLRRLANTYDVVAVSGAVALPRAAHVALAVAPGLMGVRGRFRVLTASAYGILMA